MSGSRCAGVLQRMNHAAARPAASGFANSIAALRRQEEFRYPDALPVWLRVLAPTRRAAISIDNNLTGDPQST
jgi:hypothetical protein